MQHNHARQRAQNNTEVVKRSQKKQRGQFKENAKNYRKPKEISPKEKAREVKTDVAR